MHTCEQRRGERGTGLVIAVLVIVAVTLSAVALLVFTNSAFARVQSETKLERAALIADAGLSWYVEQFRRDKTFLDSSNGVYPVTTTARNARIGVALPCGGGTFTLTRIDAAAFGTAMSTIGRTVTVRGEYDGVLYTFQAVLSPNTMSPLQGVATTSTQTWGATSRFGSLGAVAGTIMGNSSATLNAGAIITGNAKFRTTISGTGTVTGAKVTGTAAISFPDQVAIVNAATSAAAGNKNVSGFWRSSKDDVRTQILAAASADRPVSLERVPAVVTNLNNSGESIWTGTNQMNMSHMAMRGGKLTIPPTGATTANYAFGRLFIDAGVLTIKAPPGGATLVLQQLQLANNARLILDASDGPFTIVTGKNNAYQNALSTTGSERFNTSTNVWATGTPSITITGDTNIWHNNSGGTAGVQNRKGNGTLDDWQVRDNSIFATVTSGEVTKGAELFMKTDVDLTLTAGSSVLGGVPTAHLASLQNRSLSSITLQTSIPHSSFGFQVWSAGGGNPRLDVNTDYGASANASRFVGLTYGGFPGRLGSTATLEGAFVGQSMVSNGTVLYDSRLATLVASNQPDSEHVVVRTRVR